MTLAVQSSYLHYHYDNYEGPTGSLVPELVKQQVLTRYIHLLMQRTIGAPVKDEQMMIDFLNEMSSNGQIGKQIEDQLNSQAFVESWAGKNNFESGKSLLSTGAGVGDLTYGPVKIPDEAARIALSVREIINDMIIALGNSQQYILIGQLKALRDGQPIPNYQNVKYNGFFPEQQITLADLDVQKVATKLQSRLQELDSLSNGNSSGDILTLYTILQSIKGCFNNLGGKLLEPVSMHGMNVVGYKAEQEVLKPIEDSFLASGATLRRLKAWHTGSEKIDGKDIKSDITMQATIDNIIFEIGGSIKLSQAQKVINGEKTPVIGNLHSGYTLGDMLYETHSLAGAIDLIKWYEAGFGGIKIKQGDKDVNFTNATSADWNNLIVAWEKAKEAGKYVGFARMLTGSGKTTINGIQDLAGVLIVNNKIYSMYAILQQVFNNFDTYVNIYGSGWTNSTFSGWHGQVVRAVRKKAEEDPSYSSMRVSDTQAVIQRLYNKKISMSLSLAGLGFSF